MNVNLIGNAIVGQSGGPTTAINATLAGVVRGALANKNIGKIYGMRNGIEGLLDRRIIDLGEAVGTSEQLYTLERTPAAALGSCRKKLPSVDSEKPEDIAVYERIFEILAEYDIRYFFYIGGNDSMDTVAKYSSYLSEKSIDDIKIIGIPKTIDNDLCVTDHCPGFGSAAKYVCTTVQEIARDSNVYSMPSVTIIEAMGRHAGWLAASAACIRVNGEQAPQLIYLPEAVFSSEKFIEDVKEKMKKHKAVIAVVSEGVKTADGKFAAEEYQSGQKDVFGHAYLAGIGKFLEKLVSEKIGCKVRSIELNVMQRCSSHIASAEDIESSAAIGEAAVEAALAGKSGCMMTFIRESDKPYSYSIGTTDAAVAANSEKLFPSEWINEDENDVLSAAYDYFMPLIQGEVYPVMKNGMPVHIVL